MDKTINESNANFEISLTMRLRELFCFGSLNEKEKFLMKIYRKSLNIINDKMDMVKYLKFINEYIHLKCILFKDAHSLCLNFIKKPKVHEKNRFIKINSKMVKQVKEITDYFSNVKEMTAKDRRIYTLLNKNVQKMIELSKNQN